MEGHVVNPSTKFEDPTAIHSWVMSSDIAHMIPLTIRLQPLRMRRITWPMPGVNFSRIFEIHDPDLPIHYATLMALRLSQMELLAKTVYGPVLRITQRSAHAQNHISVQRCRKCFTTIVLGDNDFPLTGSNFGNLTAFRAIFRYIFTVHAQKRLFMNFQLKFWHHHSIPWPQCPYRARYFRDLRTFSVDFCIG